MLHRLIARYRWYPWLVALLCLAVVATTNGMINAGITVFDEALLNEFGWSVGELKLRDSITFLGGSVLVLAAGSLVDRFGFKPFLVAGMALLALGYLVYPRIDSLARLYGMHLLFAMVIASAGNMTAIVTAASWVRQRRGLAIGMTIAGTSIGGMLLPPLGNWLNLSFGWRRAMQLEAVIPALMLVLIVLLIGARRGADGERIVEDSEGIAFGAVLRSTTFYRVAIAGALTYYGILSLFAHLFLYMRSLAYSPVEASLALSTLASAALAGKLLVGWISDRLDQYRLFRFQMLLMFAGLSGIAMLPGAIWPFLMVTGFGWGGLHTLYNLILLTLFGLRDAGKINGSVSLAEAVGGGVGIALTGWLFDASGSYSLGFAVMVFAMGIAVFAILGLKPAQ